MQAQLKTVHEERSEQTGECKVHLVKQRNSFNANSIFFHPQLFFPDFLHVKFPDLCLGLSDNF
jgi:hypothetical protein